MVLLVVFNGVLKRPSTLYQLVYAFTRGFWVSRARIFLCTYHLRETYLRVRSPPAALEEIYG